MRLPNDGADLSALRNNSRLSRELRGNNRRRPLVFGPVLFCNPGRNSMCAAPLFAVRFSRTRRLWPYSLSSGIDAVDASRPDDVRSKIRDARLASAELATEFRRCFVLSLR